MFGGRPSDGFRAQPRLVCAVRGMVFFASQMFSLHPWPLRIQWHPPTSVGIPKPLRVVRRGVTTDLDPIVLAGLVPGGTANPYSGLFPLAPL